MTKQNQGFISNLNLQEVSEIRRSLNILGGAGIAEDLAILQNNLRNTSTLSFNTAIGAAVTNGYFYFGPSSAFIFTNDDVVSVKTDITVGVGVTLYKDNTYYICNSNAENQFKLSTTPSSVGVSTIIVSSLPPPTDIHYTVNSVIVGTGGTGYTTIPTVTISLPTTSWGIRATAVAEVSNGSVVAINVTSNGRGYLSDPTITISKPNVGINTATATLEITPNFYTNIDFIRKEPVYKENIINLIQPDIQDDANFRYFSGGVETINSAFDSTAVANETTKYFIEKKYKSNENVTSNGDINIEGSIIINDPQGFNIGTSVLSDPKSPGIFIGDTRAFSSDNNPWAKVGTALSTSSSSVSIGELYFANDITISGISKESASSVAVTTYTHKLPVVINGETYSILLST